MAETFRRRKDGEEWALEMERNIDRKGSSKPRAARNVRTFGDLIDLHDEDMHEVGKPPRRSKAAVMAALKDALGSVKLPALNRERLIEFGRKRAKQGAGPATLAIDLSFIRTIITHAAAVHGIEVSAEEARLARVALSHLKLVGKSNERDRRPTQDELDELIEYFETNPRQFIPMGRIVRYMDCTEAVYTKLLGGRSHQIRQQRGLEPKANVRDSLSTAELSFVMAAEALAAERIEQEIRLGNSECIEASEKSALAIRGAIDSDRMSRQARLPE